MAEMAAKGDVFNGRLAGAGLGWSGPEGATQAEAAKMPANEPKGAAGDDDDNFWRWGT